MDIDIDRSSALSLRVSLARPSLIEPSTAAGKHCGTCTGAWHGVRAVRMTKECYKKRQACRASAVQRSGADPERDAVRCGARQLARSHLFGAVWQQRNVHVQRLSKQAGRRPERRRVRRGAAEGRRVRSMQCGAGCTWRSTHVWHSVATCSGARPSNCNLVHALHSEQASGAGPG